MRGLIGGERGTRRIRNGQNDSMMDTDGEKSGKSDQVTQFKAGGEIHPIRILVLKKIVLRKGSKSLLLLQFYLKIKVRDPEQKTQY